MSFETRELFGRSVRIQIPSDCFPTPEEIREIDETSGPNCKHGWYESVSDSSSYKHDDESKAQIHYRYWLPSGPPKGILVFTHGILSQSGHACRLDGRPLDVALVVDTFTAKGFAVYARVRCVDANVDMVDPIAEETAGLFSYLSLFFCNFYSFRTNTATAFPRASGFSFPRGKKTATT